MKCEKMETRMIGYLDGRASEAERRAVEAHLAACSACAGRASEFRDVWGALDEVPTREPSPAFDARLRARIAAEPRQGWWAWLVPSPRLAFAVTLLLIMSAYISSRPPAAPHEHQQPANPEAEFRMIKDLPVLENYDVLANFEALSELPPSTTTDNQEM